MEKLNIKNNGLKSIPHEFQGSLPRLAELNISGNRLETFPSLYWDDIKILDVSRNEVKSISTEALKTATSLETVNIIITGEKRNILGAGNTQDLAIEEQKETN